MSSKTNDVATADQEISPLHGSVDDLYAVYLEIAKRDHSVRIAALYGKQAPPPGHTPFRPLPREHFDARFYSSTQVAGGETIFRRQLSRLARVYGVQNVSPAARRAA